MKYNFFLILAALVIFALVAFIATFIYLSKTSEFSRASGDPSTTRPSSSQPGNP